MRRTHIHVRQVGSWSEQLNLLFRDYLREHEDAKMKYAEVKYELANLYRDQRGNYVEGKSEIVWDILMKANLWSQKIGWRPFKEDY
ncbi:GrpB family protein [Paenibacillus provencensis]|uniref:GrpB family protein n=1 Tax=Paenibacillus provencensis TaxID=441151 RepID=A0ABW3PY95_9BACL|nr:GrpB family protein [Paenibacillus sp. MER 78]